MDPVAGVGMAVAVVMLLMMSFGLVELFAECRETRIMEEYVVALSEKNSELQATYTAGYDLQEVERTALALGMVPREHVPNTQIRVAAETPEVVQTGVWQRIGMILSGLFA